MSGLSSSHTLPPWSLIAQAGFELPVYSRTIWSFWSSCLLSAGILGITFCLMWCWGWSPTHARQVPSDCTTSPSLLLFFFFKQHYHSYVRTHRSSHFLWPPLQLQHLAPFTLLKVSYLVGKTQGTSVGIGTTAKRSLRKIPQS